VNNELLTSPTGVNLRKLSLNKKNLQIKSFIKFGENIEQRFLIFLTMRTPSHHIIFMRPPQVFSNVKLLENKLSTYSESSYKLS